MVTKDYTLLQLNSPSNLDTIYVSKRCAAEWISDILVMATEIACFA
ncbi:hypothetical protein C3B55_00201 [Candidatus Pseudomonas adelgestsugas]|uniref:Uncharacterized protein n=1 Tax=Candidatus Pseudomonas adelgestsugas TaxID=1302376 RepID=A0ABX5R7E3_9PSED|nr:hypothetical protein C3B55_00201 [Candidatus Pseudomonas adelgestsugas]